MEAGASHKEVGLIFSRLQLQRYMRRGEGGYEEEMGYIGRDGMSEEREMNTVHGVCLAISLIVSLEVANTTKSRRGEE